MIFLIIIQATLTFAAFFVNPIIGSIMATILVILILILIWLIASGNSYFVYRFCCRSCTLFFISVVASPCVFTVIVISSILLGFAFLPIWGGDSFKEFFINVYTIVSALWNVWIPLWNAFAALLPSLMTLFNLLWQLLILAFNTLIVAFCNITDASEINIVGFNAFQTCPTLVNLIEDLPDVIDDTALIFADLNVLIYTIEVELKNTICHTYTGGGTGFDRLQDLDVDQDCTEMCDFLGFSPGCYNFATAIQWVFSYDNYISKTVHFAINVVDRATSPWMRNYIWYFLHDIALSEYQDDVVTVYDFVDFYINDPTEGKFFLRSILGAMVQYVLWFPDRIACYFIDFNQFISCFGEDICNVFIEPIENLIGVPIVQIIEEILSIQVTGFPSLGDFLYVFFPEEDVEDLLDLIEGGISSVICDTFTDCACKRCDSAFSDIEVDVIPGTDYDALLFDELVEWTRGPCTLGSCDGSGLSSECDSQWSLMYDFVLYIESLELLF